MTHGKRWTKEERIQSRIRAKKNAKEYFRKYYQEHKKEIDEKNKKRAEENKDKIKYYRNRKKTKLPNKIISWEQLKEKFRKSLDF